MNIVQITDEEYTKPFELYEMTITLSGTSESQIALFSTGTVGVEFRDTTALVSNVRNVKLIPHNTGMSIFLVADVAIYTSSIEEAIKDVSETFFVDIIGLGGILTLEDPSITLATN